MTTDQPDQGLGRRHLLRGGAVLAGAAGLAVAGAMKAPSAQAADGDPVLLNMINNSSGPTAIKTANPARPTLELQNDNGPVLSLQPVTSEWNGDLIVGELANTQYGPMIGVDYGDGVGPQKTFLTTALDLDALALPQAIPPARILDTRTLTGREGIVRRSSGALDASNRLKAGAWIDVAVDAANGDFTIDAAFLNLAVTGGLAGGYLSAYPPGTRPLSSTLNYATGQTIANGAFVQVGVYSTWFVVRIYASATTHVICDLTGASVAMVAGPSAVQAAARSQSKRTRPHVTRKPSPKLGRGRR